MAWLVWLGLDLIAEPFFRRALIGGAMIGLAAPLVGIFVVLRRLAMIGDTVAHVSIAGVALGFLLHFFPTFVGLVFALLASLAIEWLRGAYKSYSELSVAIIMSGGIALASLLFTIDKGYNINIVSYLFGSIYTLDRADLLLMFAVTAVSVAAVLLNYKEMFLLFFDEDAAKVSGLPMRLYNAAVSVLTALVIGVAIKIVGALLVSALLTIPVACSLLAARSFKQAVVLAVLFAEIAVLAGLLLAGAQNLAPGATIVLLLIAMLIGLLIAKRGVRF